MCCKCTPLTFKAVGCVEMGENVQYRKGKCSDGMMHVGLKERGRTTLRDENVAS